MNCGDAGGEEASRLQARSARLKQSISMAKYSENSINLRNSERSESWRPTGWRPRRGRARCRAERGLRASRAEMTARRRMVMRHGVRERRFPRKTQAGAGVGKAARRRKRAGRGYMLPLARVEHGLTLWQRMLPLKPEQSRTPRTTPSTRFCNRAFPPEGEVSKHKGIFDERIPCRRNVRARSFAEHE